MYDWNMWVPFLIYSSWISDSGIVSTQIRRRSVLILMPSQGGTHQCACFSIFSKYAIVHTSVESVWPFALSAQSQFVRELFSMLPWTQPDQCLRILRWYAISPRSFPEPSLTNFPCVRILRLYVISSWSWTRPDQCLRILRMYVISSRSFPEPNLTNVSASSACTWFLFDPSRNPAWQIFLVSASSGCT